MGHNLISCCKKCKVKIFHFRREENKTILPFYEKHSECLKENISNIETFMGNNGYEPEWYLHNKYKDDDLQE